MSALVKNVVIAGATGQLGPTVLKNLVDSAKFNIRVLKRAGSTSTVPAGVDVVEVDYSSVDSLKAAVRGYDAVVSTLTTAAAEVQINLIDASVAAGVKRFIPSEYGSNLGNPKTRQLPVFGGKIKVQEYAIEKSKSTGLTYTFLYNNAFLDWGLRAGFIVNLTGGKPTVLNGGDNPFNATTLASVGDAVVGILTHPEETKNREVYISDILTTQNKLLALAKKVAPEKDWEPTNQSLDELTARSDDRLSKGLFDMETFGPYLFRAIYDPAYGGQYEAKDNELLGVKGVTEEDIVEIIKGILQK